MPSGMGCIASLNFGAVAVLDVLPYTSICFILTVKAPPIVCSRRQFQILPPFQK